MEQEQNSSETESLAEIPAAEAPAAEAPDAEAAAARKKELLRRAVKYGLFGAVFLAMGIITAVGGDIKTAAFAVIMTLLCGFSVWKVIRKIRKEV